MHFPISIVTSLIAISAQHQTIMPRHWVVREQAIVHELTTHSRSLSAEQASLTAQAICHEAYVRGYDPLLFLAVIHVESHYDHLAISPSGAEGLMQLMPATASWAADQYALPWLVVDSFDPVTNVQIGMHYLIELHRRFGNLDITLTAYNRGPTATARIMKEFGELPESLLNAYSNKVLRQYQQLVTTYGSLLQNTQ